MTGSGVLSGRVDAWTSATRMATITGIPGLVPVLRHVTLAVGDTAVVQVAGGQMWVVGVVGAAAPPPPVVDPTVPDAPVAPPPVGLVSLPLRPSWSGTWRGGAWRSDTSDLYQGDYTGRGINQGGCWWGRLPSVISSGSLLVARRAGAGAGAALAPTMSLLAGIARPAGAPSVLATAAGLALAPGQSGSWPVPGAWITQMAAGTAGGIGITSSGSRTPYLALSVSGVGMTLALRTPG